MKSILKKRQKTNFQVQGHVQSYKIHEIQIQLWKLEKSEERSLFFENNSIGLIKIPTNLQMLASNGSYQPLK